MEITCGSCGRHLTIDHVEIQRGKNGMLYIDIYYNCTFEHCPANDKCIIRVHEFSRGITKDSKINVS